MIGYLPEIFIRSNQKRMYEYDLTMRAMLAQKHCEYSMTIYNVPMFENILECEKKATTDIYVVSDDDIIPSRADTVRRLCEKMDEHPEIGIMGLAWHPALSPDSFAAWTKEEIEWKLWEVDHVGGITAIRRGILEDMGDRPNTLLAIGDDKLIANVIRKKGYKVAIWLDDCFYHIGEGKSTVWGQQS